MRLYYEGFRIVNENLRTSFDAVGEAWLAANRGMGKGLGGDEVVLGLR